MIICMVCEAVIDLYNDPRAQPWGWVSSGTRGWAFHLKFPTNQLRWDRCRSYYFLFFLSHEKKKAKWVRSGTWGWAFHLKFLTNQMRLTQMQQLLIFCKFFLSRMKRKNQNSHPSFSNMVNVNTIYFLSCREKSRTQDL
jgi:hypothetical protein